MKPWDLLLATAVVLVVIAAGAVDWRLGAAVAGVALGNVWFWFEEDADAEDR